MHRTWLKVSTYLNPIIVRIQDEGDILHSTVSHPFLPIDTLLFKALARSLHVIDCDADMAESLRLIVPIMIFEVSILFRSVIPGQLKEAFLVRRLIDTAS